MLAGRSSAARNPSFVGAIAELTLIGAALGADEIAALSTRSLALAPAELIAYWDFRRSDGAASLGEAGKPKLLGGARIVRDELLALDAEWAEVEEARDEVRRERQAAVDALDRAEAEVQSAQRAVDGLLDQIEDLEDYWDELPSVDWPWKESKASEWWWVGPELGALYTAYGLATLALDAAIGVLDLAEAAVELTPIDLDPRVAERLIEVGTKELALEAAYGVLDAAAEVVEGAAKIADDLASLALGEFFDIRRASFEAELGALDVDEGGDPPSRVVSLSAEVIFLKQDYTIEFEIDLANFSATSAVAALLDASGNLLPRAG